MVICLGTVWLLVEHPVTFMELDAIILGEPTFMLVEISNKNTNKQEVYTLLILLQYKESDYLDFFRKDEKIYI